MKGNTMQKFKKLFLLTLSVLRPQLRSFFINKTKFGHNQTVANSDKKYEVQS